MRPEKREKATERLKSDVDTVRKREQVFRVDERENGMERDENSGTEDTGQSFRNGGRGKTKNTNGWERGLRAEEKEKEGIQKGEMNGDREKHEQIGDRQQRGESRETEGKEFTWRRWRKGGPSERDGR